MAGKTECTLPLLAINLAEDLAGDQDAARIGKPFQPDRDVDPVSEEVAIFPDDNVAKIDPDAQLEATAARLVSLLHF